MSSDSADFTGSVPEFYERHLVPVIFAPYADDLVARVPARDGIAVLELAAGTGVVTRRLLARLPGSARIVATDLEPAMIEEARHRVPDDPRLELRAADLAALPFADAEFDVALCQFGVMFLTDKLAAMRSVRRVLRPGATFLFNVMDAFEVNPFGRIAHEAIGSFFETDAPQFYRKPFSWADPPAIERTLKQAGFHAVTIEKVAGELTGSSIRDFAVGLVRGNPAIGAIADRGLDAEAITDRVAEDLREVYGDGPFRGPIRAIVVTAKA